MTQKLRIMIVDDDVVDCKRVKRLLEETALDAITHSISSAEECLKMLKVTAVDCILLDYNLPSMNGIDFLVALREACRAGGPVVVMLSGSGNERIVVQAMRLGVQDYLVKDEVTAESLEEAIVHAIAAAQERAAAVAESQRLEALAMSDPVTGVGNRNLFNTRFDHALLRAGRQKDEVGLLYLDLDRFKEINDTFGHAAGDAVLVEVGRRLVNLARDSDTVARLGGDEFAIIMETGVSDAGAKRLCARVKEALSGAMTIGRQEVRIGASIGVARFPDDATAAEDLIRAADLAMYEAKFGLRLERDLLLQGAGD